MVLPWKSVPFLQYYHKFHLQNCGYYSTYYLRPHYRAGLQLVYEFFSGTCSRGLSWIKGHLFCCCCLSILVFCHYCWFGWVSHKWSFEICGAGFYGPSGLSLHCPTALNQGEEASTCKRTVTHVGNVFVPRNLDLWPAFVAEWLTHSAAMCSRAWRAQWPVFDSARARPSTKELFLIIPTHVMNREIIPGRNKEGLTVSSINCDRCSVKFACRAGVSRS